MSFKLPVFDKIFFCIVNSASINIAALISSYTYNKNVYTPFFECKTPSISKPEIIIDGFHEDYISVTLGRFYKLNISKSVDKVLYIK